MTKDVPERDLSLEHALEEAEGTEVQEDPSHGRSLEAGREQAQGFEIFEDPDAVLPASLLKEGAPGHETLTGDRPGLQDDDEEERVTDMDEEW
jgi:hypothetical protein